LDGLSKEDKRLFGYLVYLDEKRVESGEFPMLLEQREGKGAFEKLIDLNRQFTEIAGNVSPMTSSGSPNSVTFGNTVYTAEEFANMQSRYANALAEAAKRNFGTAQAKNSFIKSMSGLNDMQIGHINQYAQGRVNFASEESTFAFDGHLF
jgi:hypothetical protein